MKSKRLSRACSNKSGRRGPPYNARCSCANKGRRISAQNGIRAFAYVLRTRYLTTSIVIINLCIRGARSSRAHAVKQIAHPTDLVVAEG